MRRSLIAKLRLAKLNFYDTDISNTIKQTWKCSLFYRWSGVAGWQQLLYIYHAATSLNTLLLLRGYGSLNVADGN